MTTCTAAARKQVPAIVAAEERRRLVKCMLVAGQLLMHSCWSVCCGATGMLSQPVEGTSRAFPPPGPCAQCQVPFQGNSNCLPALGFSRQHIHTYTLYRVVVRHPCPNWPRHQLVVAAVAASPVLPASGEPECSPCNAVPVGLQLDN
jgi:hypothetical protein